MQGRVRAMVATDVAARGIHVEGVAAVVHFDPTDDAKTYLHRSGRTARAGREGVVVSLVTADQRRQVGAIQRMIGLSDIFVEPAAATLDTAGERAGQLRERGPGPGAATTRASGDRRGAGRGRRRRR